MAVAASSWDRMDMLPLPWPVHWCTLKGSLVMRGHPTRWKAATALSLHASWIAALRGFFHVFFGMKSIRLLENYRDSNGANFGCILVKHIKITSFNQKCFRTHQILFVVFFLFHFSSCGLFSRCAFAEDRSHGTFVFCQRHCQDF